MFARNSATLCTSQWYCDPSTVVKVSRELKGHKYSFAQIWQIFPFLEPFYTKYEKNFDVGDAFLFIHFNWWVPVVSIALYFAMIWTVPKLFRGRPLKVDKPLAVWNLLLAVFSIIGTLRVVPHLIWFWYHDGFKATICAQPQTINGDGSTGLWCLLFTLSKIAELIDTLFVCLKGRDPIFLHWYHHVTVLAFTWAAYAARHPGMHFVAMNFTVHAIMYTYFFLMAMNAKPKWLNPMYITFMQISQMVAGVIITVYSFYYHAKDSECATVHEVLYFQGLIYGSYLYLFLEFMFKRFFSKPKKSAKDAVEQNGASKKAQ